MKENHSIIDKLFEGLNIEKKTNTKLMHPLVLAFVGDTIFDLAIRTMLVEKFDAKVHKLHRLSSSRARASAQAKAARVIFDELNEDEKDVFMRARNTKSGTVPKSASLEEYSLSSALEAVMGFLYLEGSDDRLMHLLKASLDAQDGDTAAIIDVFRP